MKKYVTPAALFLPLVLVSTVYASDTSLEGGFDLTGQQRDAKASLYQGSFRSTVRDIKETNKEGTLLAGEVAHLMSTADLISRGRAAHEIEVAKHQENAKRQNANTREVNVQTASFNATCNGTVDEGTYNWCMGEKARIQPLIDRNNAWGKEVSENRAGLIKNLRLLDTADAQLKKSAAALEQKVTVYFEKYTMLVQRAKDFREKLSQLQTGYDACKNAQGSLEKVHEICGMMFDGNIVRETETNYPIPDPTFK